MIRQIVVATPIGGVRIRADGEAIVEVHLPAEATGASGTDAVATPPAGDRRRDTRPDDPLLRRADAQMREYFAGERTDFDLPLAPAGTAWQQRVWTALRGIPYGGTVSYVDIARRLGAPGASRAVGGANGANPIAIVIPCHRVIAAGGGLGGYSGGLATKRWLLAHERRVSDGARASGDAAGRR